MAKLAEKLKSSKSQFDEEKAALLAQISELDIAKTAKSESGVEENEKLKDTCNKLMKKLKEMKSEKDQISSSLAETEIAKSDILSQLDAMKTALETSASELSYLKANHEEVTKLCTSFEVELVQVRSCKNIVDAELLDLKPKLESATQELVSRDIKISELEAALNSPSALATDTNSALTAELNELKQQYSSLQTEITTLTDVNEKLKVSLSESALALEKEGEEREKIKGMLTKAMDKLKAVTASSKEEKTASEKEISDLKAELQFSRQKNEEVLSLEDRASTRERKIKELEATVRKNEELYADLLMKTDDQGRVIKSKEKKIDECETHIEEISAELKRTRHDFSAICKECGVLESLATRLERLFFPSIETRMPGQGESSEQALNTLTAATGFIFYEVFICVLFNIHCLRHQLYLFFISRPSV